ncbi:MAG: glycosyltransferase [Planctomycetota bacterium]
MVITELHPGGAEKCFVHLACFLKNQGHEVRVWQLYPKTPSNKRQLVQKLDDHEISVTDLGASSWTKMPGVARRLRGELAAFQPDVVQSFLFHANVLAAFACPSSTCFFGGARVAQPQRWRGWLQRFATRKMQKLICVSQSVADNCQQTEKISAEKLCVIPNGIDLDDYSAILEDGKKKALRQLADLKGPERILLFVGRLTEQKGILPYLEHSSTWLRDNPDYRLVLVGDGEQRESVEKFIASQDLPAQIKCLGWQQNVNEWMRLANCLVLPALYEGMPNVVLEAMASGLPIACFEADGIRELLGNDDFADQQIAPLGQQQGLQDRASAILDRPKLAADLAVSNLKRVEDEFQLHKQLLKYEQLYLDSLQH